VDLEDEYDENVKSNIRSKDSSLRNGNPNNFSFVKYNIQSEAEKPDRIDVADVKSMMDTRQCFNELKEKKIDEYVPMVDVKLQESDLKK